MADQENKRINEKDKDVFAGFAYKRGEEVVVRVGKIKFKIKFRKLKEVKYTAEDGTVKAYTTNLYSKTGVNWWREEDIELLSEGK